MIRFSCPGCGATYSVDDAKGGKTGKCPKCQSQFLIPMPEGGAAPPPAPKPPIDPNAPVEIAPCPKCDARLSVAASDVGVDVECPYCKTVYKAVRPGSGGTSQPKARGGAGGRVAVEDEERPSRRGRRDEDEEEERPSRRRRRDEEEVEEEARPSRRRRDEEEEEEARPGRRSRRDADEEEGEERPSRRRRDEDEDEERPRKKKRRRRSGGGGGSGEPHRGVMILILGILGLLCCGLCSIAAAIMGLQDLNKMNSGDMDPDGKPLTMIGMILGFLGILLWIVGVIINVASM